MSGGCWALRMRFAGEADVSCYSVLRRLVERGCELDGWMSEVYERLLGGVIGRLAPNATYF